MKLLRVAAILIAGLTTTALAQDAPPEAEITVQSLIAAGDAALAEAAELRTRMEAIPTADSLGTTRSLTPGMTAERETLEKRITALEAQARSLWEQAAAMDPDAQDEILRRLRGIGPLQATE